jgi:hypothetical protein
MDRRWTLHGLSSQGGRPPDALATGAARPSPRRIFSIVTPAPGVNRCGPEDRHAPAATISVSCAIGNMRFLAAPHSTPPPPHLATQTDHREHCETWITHFVPPAFLHSRSAR